MGIGRAKLQAEIDEFETAEKRGGLSDDGLRLNRRRRMMLALAIECVRRGFGGLTFETVALRAGVSKADALDLFTNQLDLLFQSITEFVESTEPELRRAVTDPGARSPLRSGVGELVTRVELNPGLALLTFREGVVLEIAQREVLPAHHLLGIIVDSMPGESGTQALVGETRFAVIGGMCSLVASRLIGEGEPKLGELVDTLEFAVLNAAR